MVAARRVHGGNRAVVPTGPAKHELTAKLANTCTKSGEDYTVSNVKLDVVSFH